MCLVEKELAKANPLILTVTIGPRTHSASKRLTIPGCLATSGGPAGGSEVGNLAQCAVL